MGIRSPCEPAGSGELIVIVITLFLEVTYLDKIPVRHMILIWDRGYGQECHDRIYTVCYSV